MKHLKLHFSKLLSQYNRYLRKLQNLQILNRNNRRQEILQTHILRLERKLQKLFLSIQKKSLHTLGVAAATLMLSSSMQGQQITFEPFVLNPFDLVPASTGRLTPTFVDLDNDGDIDLVTGDVVGDFFYYENIGTNTAPLFDTAQSNPFGLQSVSIFGSPTFADLDNDGDFDMIAGTYSNDLLYFENIGTATNPNFDTLQSNPFGIAPIFNRIKPALVDIDGDGDFDLFCGLGGSDGFDYYENTGTADAPAFAPVENNPFGITSTGQYSTTAAFSDIDGDGDLDLLSGAQYYGFYLYFENVGSSTAPDFAAFQVNPFNIAPDDFSSYSAIGIADLDNDGDGDLLVGDLLGNDLFYFENSSVLSVEDNQFTNGDITIYPNPTSDQLIINAQNSALQRVKIYDITGRLVQEHELNQITEQILNVQELKTGTYFMSFETTGGNTITKHLLKN